MRTSNLAVAFIGITVVNASVSFGWTTTTSTNLPPTLKNPGNQTSQVGKSASLLLIGADPEGKALSYKATGLPAGLALNAATGLISGTPTTTAVYSVTATVSDGALTTSVSFSWSIVTTLDTKPPVVAVKNVKAGSTIKLTGTSIALTGTATDNTGVRMVWWYTDRGGLALAAGTSSWSATIPLQKGKNVITISATDAADNLGTFKFTVDAR